MKYKAIIKGIAYSPYKLRPIVDVIRNKNVDFALKWLQAYNNRRTVIIYKAISSVLANARYAKCSDADKDMIITKIYVDQGIVRKYFRPGSQGRAKILRKRYCHLSVYIEPKSVVLVKTKRSM